MSSRLQGICHLRYLNTLVIELKLVLSFVTVGPKAILSLYIGGQYHGCPAWIRAHTENKSK